MHLLHPEFRSDITDDDLLTLYAWPDGTRHLRANMVASIDGVVRGPDGVSSSLSNAADKRVFRMLRRTADAIVIGAGTIAAEDVGPLRPNQTWEQWRREHRDRVQVPIIAVSNRGSLPPSSRLFSGPPGSAMLVMPETTDPHRVEQLRAVTEVVLLGRDRVDLAALLTWLADQGYLRALTEGGPALLADILPWVDDLCLTTVPTLLGGVDPARPMPDLLAGTQVQQTGAEMAHLLLEDDTQLTRWKLRHG